MAQRLRILESWNQFRQKVMHPEAPPIQVKEMKLAFYAGAASCFAFLLSDMSPGDEPQESDLDMCKDVDKELRDFAQAVQERKI